MNAFFAALETKGGNLFILSLFTLLSGIAMNRIHYSDQVDTVMIANFSAWTGALINALISNVKTVPQTENKPG